MDAMDKIRKARVSLLLDSPFFGSLSMYLQPKPMPDGVFMKTMAVDFKGNLFYGEEFVNSLSPDEMRFVLGHEVLHLVLGHLTRKGGRTHQRWQIACDFAVNPITMNAKIGKAPADMLYEPDWVDKSSEEIYRLLPKEPEGGGTGEQGNGEGDDNIGDSGKGVDTLPRGGWDEHIHAGEDKGGKGANVPEQELKEIEANWKARVSQATASARMQGKLPGGLEELIDELLQPKIDWRTLLWQFVIQCARDDYRWYPPNRRHVHNGIYLPTLKSESFELAVAVDSSSSVSDKELKQFLSEVQAILDLHASCTLHMYVCDARVQSYHEYQTGDMIELDVKGRLGTDFRPVYNDIDDKGLEISSLIYLTDGKGTYPQSPPIFPTLWVLCQNYEVPFGESVRIEVG